MGAHDVADAPAEVAALANNGWRAHDRRRRVWKRRFLLFMLVRLVGTVMVLFGLAWLTATGPARRLSAGSASP